jgi:hypothetical protein
LSRRIVAAAIVGLYLVVALGIAGLGARRTEVA